MGNVGVTEVLTVMGNVTTEAQATEGVNVKLAVFGVEVFTEAGLHVPGIPSLDVVGKVPDPPVQYDPTAFIAGKEGVTELATVIGIVIVEAPCPALGVKV